MESIQWILMQIYMPLYIKLDHNKFNLLPGINLDKHQPHQILGYKNFISFHNVRFCLHKTNNQRSLSFLFCVVQCSFNCHYTHISSFNNKTMYMGSNNVCMFFFLLLFCRFQMCELMNTFSLMYIKR